MDRIDTLIRELEEAPEGCWGLWLRVVRFSCKQGWHDNQRLMINEHLIDQAEQIEEESILIAVALSLVPEGWGWLLEIWQREESWAQVVRRPKGSTQPSGIFEGAEAKTPALALASAALKAAQRGA